MKNFFVSLILFFVWSSAFADTNFVLNTEVRTTYVGSIGAVSCNQPIATVSPGVTMDNGMYANIWSAFSNTQNNTGCREDDYILGWKGNLFSAESGVSANVSLSYYDLRGGVSNVISPTVNIGYRLNPNLEVSVERQYIRQLNGNVMEANTLSASYQTSLADEWKLTTIGSFHATTLSKHWGVKMEASKNLTKDINLNVGFQQYLGSFNKGYVYTGVGIGF